MSDEIERTLGAQAIRLSLQQKSSSCRQVPHKRNGARLGRGSKDEQIIPEWANHAGAGDARGWTRARWSDTGRQGQTGNYAKELRMMVWGLDESEVDEQHKWAMLNQAGKVDKVDCWRLTVGAANKKSGCV